MKLKTLLLTIAFASSSQAQVDPGRKADLDALKEKVLAELNKDLPPIPRTGAESITEALSIGSLILPNYTGRDTQSGVYFRAKVSFISGGPRDRVVSRYTSTCVGVAGKEAGNWNSIQVTCAPRFIREVPGRFESLVELSKAIDKRINPFVPRNSLGRTCKVSPSSVIIPDFHGLERDTDGLLVTAKTFCRNNPPIRTIDMGDTCVGTVQLVNSSWRVHALACKINP